MLPDLKGQFEIIYSFDSSVRFGSYLFAQNFIFQHSFLLLQIHLENLLII